MFKKSLFAALSLSLASAASAGLSGHMVFQATSTPVFSYSSATTSHPVVVEAKSDDGKCLLKVALVGVQSGPTIDSSLTGRIQSGQCDGKSVQHGHVIGSVSRSGDQVSLNAHMDVFILDK